MRPVVALFVRRDGPYQGMAIDCWPEDRDARLYPGPFPVIAHPPCERWGNFWWSGPKGHDGLGDDGGCFAAALAILRRWGGVLEHPAGSRAWPAFGLPRPVAGVWTEPEWNEDGPWSWRDLRTWTTELRQFEHGHRGLKATWLLYFGQRPPGEIRWDEPGGPSLHVRAASQAALFDPPRTARPVEMMSRREREETPESFARLLVDLADNCMVRITT